MPTPQELLARNIGNALTNIKTWDGVLYNVLDEGLVGGGLVDDTVALQQLVDKAIAAGRRTIMFPHGDNGQYYVTSLTNADQVDFIGDNCTFVGGYTGTIENFGGIAALQAEFTQYNLIHYMQGGKTAIGAMTDILSEVNAGSGGVSIYIPDGEYDFEGITTSFKILKDNVWIVGDSLGSSILKVRDNRLFQWGDASGMVVGGGIDKIKFQCDTTPTNGQTCVYLFNASSQKFNIDIENISAMFILGDTAGTYKSYNVWAKVHGYKYNNAFPLINVFGGAGLFLDGNTYVGGVLPPVGRSDMTTIAGCDMILISGSWDTLHVEGLHERYYRNISGVLGAGKTVLNIVVDATFDYTRSNCISLTVSGGTLSNVYINPGSWLVSWEGDNVYIDCTSGLIKGVSISGCKMPISGSRAIYINNVKVVKVIDNVISGIGQKTTSPYAIYINGTCVDVEAVGNVGVDGTDVGITWATQLFFFISAASDRYKVMRNNFDYYDVPSPSTTSKDRLVRDNITRIATSSEWYSGNKPFTLPASGVAYTHSVPFEAEIYFSGGTVTNISKNGVQIYSSSNVMVTLVPGDTLTVTYSVAPTVKYFVKP